MGRLKSTGGSHNKSSATYRSANRLAVVTGKHSKQTSLVNFFQRKEAKENEPSTSSSNMNETNQDITSMSDHETSSSEKESDSDSDSKVSSSEEEDNIIDIEDQVIDGRSYLREHQTQAKWEEKYEFAIYSASGGGWLCKTCSEYGDGEYWRLKAVKIWEHPKRTFKKHEHSAKHVAAKKKRLEVKQMLSRGTVYKQMVKGEQVLKRNTKARNRRVIKKFLKTTYFVAKKNWAVRENFQDIVDYLRDLGDDDINAHLMDCSSRAAYTSVATVDEFLKCISEYLENGLLTRIIAAIDFSLLADETTDMADRAVLSIFIRFVDSDSYTVTEEYLGLVEVVGSKGAEELCKKICEVLRDKEVDINQLRFHGFDGTNTMSGERTGLQRRMRHLTPHSKYMNCRNHRLALVFVHLLPQFEPLTEVDSNILAVWKMMKYSSVKSAVFGAAQSAEGKKPVKLLKCATTRWLSHGEASVRLISRFEPLINALNAIINRSRDPEVRGIRDQLLNPDNVLFLLLLADVLTHVNRFSRFLQTRNLMYSNVNNKLQQLQDSLLVIEQGDGPLFLAHAEEFLAISRDRLGLARRLRANDLLEDNDDLKHRIQSFKSKVKFPFMTELQREINLALKIDEEVLLAFDVFNIRSRMTPDEKKDSITTLVDFYGTANVSTFQNDTVTSLGLFDNNVNIEQSELCFFDDFSKSVKRGEKKRNENIALQVRNGSLLVNNIDAYKEEEHPVASDTIYGELFSEREQYPQIMKLFKLSLLITPSTANVERGFSVLNLVHTKQRNRLSVMSLDMLMRIVLVGQKKLDDDVYESLVNKYRDMSDRRIVL